MGETMVVIGIVCLFVIPPLLILVGVHMAANEIDDEVKW